MGFFKSDKFISACAAGADWRETSRVILESLDTSLKEKKYNIGFIYIADSLADDAVSILNLFRSITGIRHWVGSVGLGVCGTGEEHVDGAAIAVMAGYIDEKDFCIFPALDLNFEPARTILEPWLENSDPMLVLVHGDPMSSTEPAAVLNQLEQMTGGFIAGGMSSSRGAHLQFADEVMQDGVSGIAFSQNVEVASTLTQGCAPIGPVHTVTRCEENVVMELDGQRAFDVFAADLKAMAAKKSDVPLRAQEILAAADIDQKEEAGDLFRGEVHVAFPVTGSDQQDYLVRNALGIDPDKGWIAVAHHVANGERMMFVHRDNNTVRADLSRALLALRRRLEEERGAFNPQGALYISCVARTMSDFGAGPGGEMKLVQEIIGDVPLAGFYANGEISNRRLYGYTAILILFF